MREIPLSRGRFVALVDDEDFDRVMDAGRWKCNTLALNSHGIAHRYAQRKFSSDGKKRTVMMHRFILSAPNGLMVDHVNHDGLDNRRSNIRLATRAENSAHRTKARGTASRFLGVYWHKRGQKWAAKCGSTHIGLFDLESDAAVAYDRLAVDRYGEFATLNLPEELLALIG